MNSCSFNRAGMMTRDEVLERLGSTIADCENAPRPLADLAALQKALFDAWLR
ncbi:MAG: hypothetical protein ACXW2O_03270 [Candidatus Aminicenantales bacterium]